MFDKLKSLGAVASLLKNQDQIRQAAGRVKEKMERTRCTGTGGNGAVKATVSGQLKVVSIDLTPALAQGIAKDDKTRQLAGNIIAEAVNDGMAQVLGKLKEAIDAETKGLGLPELPGLDQLLSLASN